MRGPVGGSVPAASLLLGSQRGPPPSGLGLSSQSGAAPVMPRRGGPTTLTGEPAGPPQRSTKAAGKRKRDRSPSPPMGSAVAEPEPSPIKKAKTKDLPQPSPIQKAKGQDPPQPSPSKKAKGKVLPPRASRPTPGAMSALATGPTTPSTTPQSGKPRLLAEPSAVPPYAPVGRPEGFDADHHPNLPKSPGKTPPSSDSGEDDESSSRRKKNKSAKARRRRAKGKARAAHTPPSITSYERIRKDYPGTIVHESFNRRPLPRAFLRYQPTDRRQVRRAPLDLPLIARASHWKKVYKDWRLLQFVVRTRLGFVVLNLTDPRYFLANQPVPPVSRGEPPGHLWLARTRTSLLGL